MANRNPLFIPAHPLLVFGADVRLALSDPPR